LKALWDYASLPIVKQYVCVSQPEPRMSDWLRDTEGRLLAQDDIVDTRGQVAVIGLLEALRVADIYEGTGPVDQSSINSR
jgi:hypothetical protein